MNAKKTDLKELEGWYEKSGNQLMLLYGGMDCRKEQLIKEFCVGKKYFYYPVMLFGNVVINKIPSRNIRKWYAQLWGVRIGKSYF